MTVAVVGLWHLGCVTAACVAEKGFEVIGIDASSTLIADLQHNKPPISEPNLAELITKHQQQKRLSFTTDKALVNKADVVWVTFDTPVDDNDNADTAFVEQQIISLFPYLREDSIVLISSQVPVGTTAKMQEKFAAEFPQKKVSFAYSPENLRLGKSISYFLSPDRIVIGTDNEAAKQKLAVFLSHFTSNLVFMRVASAEMTKHALNAFLATSVTFINEIARVCEFVGANAYEVEQGLKSEVRIGPGAYLRPGEAFAGGTLARDVRFLCNLSQQFDFPTHMFPAIIESNNQHKDWIKSTLLKHYQDNLANKKITILGLTYKPDTDTLRRSEMVELISWLNLQNATVTAFDPAVKALPAELKLNVNLAEQYIDAINESEVIVVGTRWPQFKDAAQQHFSQLKTNCVFIDATGFLEDAVKQHNFSSYYKVGCKYDT